MSDHLVSTRRNLREILAHNQRSALTPALSAALPASGAIDAGQSRYDQQAARVLDALKRDHADLVAQTNLNDEAGQELLRRAIREKILALPDLLPGDIEYIQRRCEASILGLPDLAELLADTSVLEIQMLGPGVGFSRRTNRPYGRDPAVRFAPGRADQSVLNDLQHFAQTYGVKLDASTPYASFMALGWRVSIHIPPHIDGYPFSLVMRRGAGAGNRITRDQLIKSCTLDALTMDFLEVLMDTHQTILIFGPQRAGKTVLQGALLDHTDPERGMQLLIQDILENQPSIPVLSLHTVQRPEHPITMTELLEWSLRESAVRITVGEIRRKEALPFVESAQMGTDALGTFHAKSARDATERLATLLLASIPNLSDRAAYRTIHQAIGWYVQMASFVEPATRTASYRLVGVYELLPTDGAVTKEHYRPIIRWEFRGWDPVTHAAVGRHYVANPLTEERYQEVLEGGNYSVDIPEELRPPGGQSRRAAPARPRAATTSARGDAARAVGARPASSQSRRRSDKSSSASQGLVLEMPPEVPAAPPS